MVVEDGLVERDRQGLVRSEPNDVAELALVVDAFDVDRAHADAVGADAEPDAPARKLVVAEEAVERRRERRDVAHLAADDDAGLERNPRELHELRGGPPLLTTREAAIWEAPILRPTISCFRRRLRLALLGFVTPGVFASSSAAGRGPTA